MGSMATRMAAALRALRAGEITFAQFEQRTREDWNKLAGKMYRRWKLPPGVGEEDVRQEMLLRAWRAAVDFDPERGKSIEDFVVWRACNGSAKHLHSQRNSLRRSGREQSRFPLTMGALRIDDDGELTESEKLDLFAQTPADQERMVDSARVAELVVAIGETPLDRDALVAWMRAGGDVAEAGIELWYDVVARADHNLRTPAQGVRAVERAVEQAMKELEALS
jgi:DNA-directed RNA polymerase specialized sigma24 family protein